MKQSAERIPVASSLPAKSRASVEFLSSADYSRLAEECFVLAAVAKRQEVAAQLIKTGDDYLRRADQLFATGPGIALP